MIQVGFSAKYTSPNEDFNQIGNLTMSHVRLLTDSTKSHHIWLHDSAKLTFFLHLLSILSYFSILFDRKCSVVSSFLEFHADWWTTAFFYGHVLCIVQRISPHVCVKNQFRSAKYSPSMLLGDTNKMVAVILYRLKTVSISWHFGPLFKYFIFKFL